MFKGLLFAAMGTLAGCASFTPAQVVTPSNMEISEVMRQVGAGLHNMWEAEKGQKFGLIPSGAELVLKVTVDAKDSNKLVLDISPSSLSKATNPLKANGEIDHSSEAGRDNTITIKFVNVLTLPKETLGYEHPGELSTVFKALNDNDIQYLKLLEAKKPVGQ